MRSFHLRVWLILLGGIALFTSMPTGAESAIHLRVNQLGYIPQDSKWAFALTDDDLSGQTFDVVLSTDGTVFTGNVGQDRGAYGNFDHLYELDFSSLSDPGTYHLSIGGSVSPDFTIGANVYSTLLAPTLEFFRVQRCGNTDPLLHGSCHLSDGVAKGGAKSGKLHNASGGWHDAGDYLKFLITAGFSTNIILVSYVRQSEVLDAIDDNVNGIPDVLDEARTGLDWILKLWDSKRKILYYQVGDASDHAMGWRMPEADELFPRRPVWPCKKGRGANVAGKAAAALALGAVIWNDSSRSFYNPVLAATYRKV